ncbi:MAG: hypothetical protein QOF25_1089 [Mycobacterium sp.]|nr:hypothetical protein [Mycobacterium sp.]
MLFSHALPHDPAPRRETPLVDILALRPRPGIRLPSGIVGPIFLVVYFAAQPEPTLKWMYWAGLFVTATDVLIALALTNAAARPGKARKASG